MDSLADERKSKHHKEVPFVFCLPGHPSSGVQELNLFNVFLNFTRMGIPFGLAHAEANNIYAVRNGCIGKGFRRDQKPLQDRYPTYNRMIWVDSDNVISTKDVLALIKHDVDIVGAWYRMWNGVQPLSDENRTACGFWEIKDGYSKVKALTVKDIPETPKNEKGLIEVDYAGFGLMVIKQGVFEALEYPWFRSKVIYWKDDEGVEMADITTDDADLCFRLKDKGYKILIDPSVRVSHDKRGLV